MKTSAPIGAARPRGALRPVTALLIALVLAMLAGPRPADAQTVTGNGRQYQPITLTYTVPGASSAAQPSLDYRLNVTFTGPDGTFVVPGYYDGGDTYRVKFAPQDAGTYTYATDFKTAPAIAVNEDPSVCPGCSPVAGDGASGSVDVTNAPSTAPYFYKKGMLKHANNYFYKHDNGHFFEKFGANSPEDWLGFEGIENTPDISESDDWAEYVPNWSDNGTAADDPVFTNSANGAGGTGKGLAGAVNWLSGKGMNSLYFLTMSAGGDRSTTAPFLKTNYGGDPDAVRGNCGSGTPTGTTFTKYDTQKLADWEKFFLHAEKKGMLLEMVLNEANSPNECFFDNSSDLKNDRKLYFREMVARFGHHNGVQWTVREEYDFNAGGTGSVNNSYITVAQAKERADYLKAVDPYDHPVAMHDQSDDNGPRLEPNGTLKYGDYGAQNIESGFGQFYGYKSVDAASLQRIEETAFNGATHNNDGQTPTESIETMRADTAAAGKKVPISLDEPSGVHKSTDVAQRAKEANMYRKALVFPAYVSGGQASVYFTDRLDLEIQDFGPYEQFYTTMGNAKILMNSVPFQQMIPADGKISGEAPFTGEFYASGEAGAPVKASANIDAQLYHKAGVAYLAYYPKASNTGTISIGSTNAGTYTKRWFNPRSGEFSAPEQVTVDATYSPGAPPSDATEDWALLLDKSDSTPPAPDTTAPTVQENTPTGSKQPTNAAYKVTFSEDVDPATVNDQTFLLEESIDALPSPKPSTVTYDAGTRTATLKANSGLSTDASQLVTLKGGANGVKDLAGNPLASDLTWTTDTYCTDDLRATYYNNTTLTHPWALSECAANVNEDWGAGSPDPDVNADSFSTRHKGTLNVPVAGEAYTFHITHNDGARLKIDGQLVYDDFTGGSVTGAASQPVTLDAGFHQFDLEHYEGANSANLSVEWSSPSVPREVIPAAAFSD